MYLVIGKQDCNLCEKAVELLDKQYKEDGIRYAYKCLSRMESYEIANWKHFLKHEVGATTVPQIFKLVGGYDQLLERIGDKYEHIKKED